MVISGEIEWRDALHSRAYSISEGADRVAWIGLWNKKCGTIK
jgi:hypothetical protein